MTESSYVIKELADALAVYAKQVFGLMGNGNAHLIDELIKRDCVYTAMRHEAGTVAAADAFTRVSGELAIATTTYGAGFTNSLTALAEAVKARVPMIVVAGDEPVGSPRAIDVDQEMLTVALGTRNYRISEGNVTRTVKKAVRFALQVRKPVVIGIPYDLIKGAKNSPLAEIEDGTLRDDFKLDDPNLMASLTQAVMGVEGVEKPKTVPLNTQTVSLRVPAVSSVQVEEAIEVLRSASRPLILAGRGAWLAGAEEIITETAHALGAVTASTALARGIFQNPEYDLGITGGFGAEVAMEIVEQADVVLVVGASLNQFTMRFGDLFGEGAKIVRVDVDAVSPPSTNLPTKHTLVQGDAKEALQLILAALRDEKHAPSSWRDEVALRIASGETSNRETGVKENPSGICADGLLDPRQVAIRIAELLPEDIHITQDGGHFIGWANMFWPVKSPERLIMVGTAYQTIGLGFPTVAGVAQAVPESTIVLSTGDGGGLMALADLESAVRTAKSCIIVVWNDAAYGAEVHLYGVMGLNEDPMHIPAVDFAQVAKSFGADSVNVRTMADLDAITEWKDRGSRGTLVLDCRISTSVVAPYQEEVQRANGL